MESSYCGGVGDGGVKIQGTKEEAFALVKNAGIVNFILETELMF